MKVVFYTRCGYLDSAFPLISRLCQQIETHLIIEISPEGRGGGFGSPADDSPSGLIPTDMAWLPLGAQARLQGLASFHLAVYTAQRAFHPGNMLICWQVAKFIRSIQPHIFHFDEASSRAVSLPYLLPRLPIVMSIHDSHPRSGESAGRFQLVRRLFLRRTQAVIFHSRYSQETFPDLPTLRSAGIEVNVIPLGIYDIFTELCDDVLNTNDRTVLFVGRISPYKGLETLFAAAPLVAQQVPNVKLIVAGRPIPGYEPPDAPELGNGGICECLLRHVSCQELCQLFRKAALIVLPYVEATQSGVVSTAYAFHKPVVATAVGGMPEMVEDGVTGRLVPPRDPEALASAIAELLLNPEERHRMAENIRRKEQDELSWARLTRMTLDVYRRAVKNCLYINTSVSKG